MQFKEMNETVEKQICEIISSQPLISYKEVSTQIKAFISSEMSIFDEKCSMRQISPARIKEYVLLQNLNAFDYKFSGYPTDADDNITIDIATDENVDFNLPVSCAFEADAEINHLPEEGCSPEVLTTQLENISHCIIQTDYLPESDSLVAAPQMNNLSEDYSMVEGIDPNNSYIFDPYNLPEGVCLVADTEIDHYFTGSLATDSQTDHLPEGYSVVTNTRTDDLPEGYSVVVNAQTDDLPEFYSLNEPGHR